MKRLIVNADDFGLTHGVNQAIARAHREGIVTSTTLMANGAAFAEAVALGRDAPDLSVGCHVVLLDGKPLQPAERLRSLLRAGDEFHSTIGQFAPKAILGRFKAEEIEEEASAQFEELRATGVAISHFDSHKHAHMFPAVVAPLIKAASRHGIRAIRNPFEPAGTLPFATALGGTKIAVRMGQVAMLRTLRSAFLAAVSQAGMATPDGSIGVAATGTLDLILLTAMIDRLPEGTWELVCHPGYNDDQLATVRTSLRASRQVELDLLTSMEAREVLNRNGVELISYRQFASQT